MIHHTQEHHVASELDASTYHGSMNTTAENIANTDAINTDSADLHVINRNATDVSDIQSFGDCKQISTVGKMPPKDWLGEISTTEEISPKDWLGEITTVEKMSPKSWLDVIFNQAANIYCSNDTTVLQLGIRANSDRCFMSPAFFLCGYGPFKLSIRTENHSNCQVHQRRKCSFKSAQGKVVFDIYFIGHENFKFTKFSMALNTTVGSMMKSDTTIVDFTQSHTSKLFRGNYVNLKNFCDTMESVNICIHGRVIEFK